MTTKKNSIENFYSNWEDQVDLKEILNTFVRSKKIFTVFCVSGVFISLLIAVFTRRTWQGEFQIVLEKSSSNTSIVTSRNRQLANLAGLNAGADKLQTEVEILKSPSVLLNIFNYVKEIKSPSGEKLRFKSWEKDLDIELEKGTSILNISYRDKNKKLILPVLNKEFFSVLL